MATLSTVSTPTTQRPTGRAYFWGGVGLFLLGLGLMPVQLFGLKFLVVPWYSPVLATLGALLLLVALTRRVSVLGVVALVLIAASAGLQWFVLAVMIKLPDYQGPARVGEQLPAFEAAYADGRSFTDVDLRDGSRRAMFFFRGRW